jgi:hypothetical protein
MARRTASAHRKGGRRQKPTKTRRAKGGSRRPPLKQLQQQRKQQQRRRLFAVAAPPLTVRELVELKETLRTNDEVPRDVIDDIIETDYRWILDNSDLIRSYDETADAAHHAIAQMDHADAWDELAKLFPDAPICSENSDNVAQMLKTTHFWVVPLTAAPIQIMTTIVWRPNLDLFRALARIHHSVGPQPAPPKLEDARRLEAKRLMLMLSASLEHMKSMGVKEKEERMSDDQRWIHALIVLAHDPELCDAAVATRDKEKGVAMVQSNLERQYYLGLRPLFTEDVAIAILKSAAAEELERCIHVLRWVVRRTLQLVEDISQEDGSDHLDTPLNALLTMVYHRREYDTTLLVVLQEIAAVARAQKKALNLHVIRFLKHVVINGSSRRPDDDDALGEETVDLLAELTGETRAATEIWLGDWAGEEEEGEEEEGEEEEGEEEEN